LGEDGLAAERTEELVLREHEVALRFVLWQVAWLEDGGAVAAAREVDWRRRVAVSNALGLKVVT
jgi:hypothetical protein